MKKKCFVIMPFSKKFDGIWREVIKPTVESNNHTCNRADNFFKIGSVLQDIFDSIVNSDYIIADLSIHNPNVYYELGFSHALKKKVILITQDISQIPFDLKDQRIIIYEDTASGASKLKIDLIKYIKNL